MQNLRQLEIPGKIQKYEMTDVIVAYYSSLQKDNTVKTV